MESSGVAWTKVGSTKITGSCRLVLRVRRLGFTVDAPDTCDQDDQSDAQRDTRPCLQADELGATTRLSNAMKSHDLAIPQLPSRSIEKTLAFYAQLGFEGAAFPGHPYAIVERGTLELHFFLHETPRPAESAFSCYLRVGDVEATFQAFSRAQLPSHGIPRIEPLENKPWGMREFAVVDEDGTLIRIGQEI